MIICLKFLFLDKYLRNKFNLDYKNKKDVKIFQFYDRIESFFEQCCYEIKEQLTNHKIILPIKGPLTAEFYLDQFYELIKEAIEFSLKNINQNYCENVPATFCACFLVFKRDLKKMCKPIINNIWKSLCVFDYFNKLFGRKVLSEKDFMDVDKIICDFFNVMRCVNKAKNDQIRTTDINLANPMLKDKFECRFIKAFEITVATPVEFGRIKAIGLKGKNISIEEGVDYFVRFYENICSIVFPFENIRTKNIQELKIISDDGKYIKNIKVDKYLKY